MEVETVEKMGVIVIVEVVKVMFEVVEEMVDVVAEMM